MMARSSEYAFYRQLAGEIPKTLRWRGEIHVIIAAPPEYFMGFIPARRR